MYASIVSRHGIHRMREYPFNLELVWRTMKSIGYSHESVDTITYSDTPSGFMVDMYANWSIVGVCIKNTWRINLSMVYFFMTLMATPKSIKVFVINLLAIWILVIGLLRLDIYEWAFSQARDQQIDLWHWYFVDPSFFFLVSLGRYLLQLC